MAEGHSIGKIFVELDLDASRYTKGQQQLLKDATTVSLNVEKNFQNLGIKSSAVFDLMRQKIINSYEMIANSSKATANDIVRAEEAKNAKLKALNEQQFGHQTSLLESLKKNWMAVSATVIGAYYMVSKFYDLAERGAKVKAVEESFTAMSKNFGVAGDALIKKMEEVTKNTIDNSDLMAKAIRLISEGFSEKQIVAVSEAARVSARLTGKTVSEAYDQISESLINLRERGLKTAGIIIDMDKAEQKHAATLGVAKEQLNDYGRRMAWAGAIMEKTKEDAAKLGESLDKLNDYEKFQQRSATWKEFGDTMGKIAGYFVNLATVIVKAHLDLLNFQKSIREWGEKKITKGLEDLGLLSPYYPITGRLTTGEGGVGREGPSQIKIADPLEVQKKLLELQKQGLSIGYQTLENKIKILDIERESTIQELKKVGMGQLIPKVWENYRKSVEEVKKVEKDRLSGLEIAFGKVVAEAEKLSDLGEMPDWRESLDYIEKGWIRVNGELRKSGAYIPVDQLGRLDVAMQGLLYDVEKLSDAGEMPDWRESLEKRLPTGFAEVNGQMVRLNDLSAKLYRQELLSLQNLETQISKEKELRDAKVSLGWMRPAEAGLAGLEDEKKLIAERMALEEQRLERLQEMKAPLADIYSQEDRITMLKREQVRLDASRLRYVSETASASKGITAGLQRYVTETGTLYTQLETMSYNTAKGMESAFSGFFQSIFDNTKSWKDRMSDLFKNLANAYIKALSDMLAKQLVSGLFGTGKTGGNNGWVGSVLSAIGGLFKTSTSTPTSYSWSSSQSGAGYSPGEWYQHGGSFWVNKPTVFGAGEGDEPEYVTVTPRSKMGANSVSAQNQSISVGPIEINMEKGPGLNPALLKRDIETAIVEVVKRHM